EAPLSVTVPQGGAWSENSVQNLAIGADTVSARLTALSVIAPFRARADASVIRVTPAQHTFGRVPEGMTAQAVFTVSNVGSGVLSGQASTSAPFAIVSGGAYELGPGRSQDVTVSFTPPARQDYQAQLVCTGGGGASRTLFGTGSRPKVISSLGCGAAGEEGGSWGNALVLLGSVALLAVGRARRGRAGAPHG